MLSETIATYADLDAKNNLGGISVMKSHVRLVVPSNNLARLGLQAKR